MRLIALFFVLLPLAASAQEPPAHGAIYGPPQPTFAEERIEPYFAKGTLQEARARFERGRYAEAAALFAQGDDGSPQAAYLRALALLELGREREAAELLVGRARIPAIADRVAWHLGLAYERLGEHEKAAEAFGSLPPWSVLFEEARLSQAHALRRTGERERALALLEDLRKKAAPAWGNDLGAAALFLAGELHTERKEKGAARDAYLTLWSEHPLAPQAEDARQRAEALIREPPSLALQVRRAQGFIDAQRNKEGVEQLERLAPRLDLSTATGCDGRYALGRGYRRMRQHSKAIATLEPVVKECHDPSLRVRALYVLGSSTSIVAPERGIQVYELLAKDYPDHSYADDALVYAADLQMRAGDWKGARKTLKRMVKRYPDGDFRADGLFRLFWLERAQGKIEDGLRFLTQLELDYARDPDSTNRERALYWQGRTLAGLGREVGAVAAYERLLRDHPASYYAMLARGRLAKMSPALLQEIEAQLAEPPQAPEVLAIATTALEADPHFASALELLRLGLSKVAADELLRIDRAAVRERAAGSSEPIVLIAYLLDRADSRRAAHQIARTELKELIRGRPEGEGATHFRIAYPLAYRDLVERHARSFQVPPDLLQALMREESSLDPNIVSWAGAIGLTQLMPATAQAVATSLKLGRVSPASLRDPDLNVRLGSSYLGSLLKRWKGNPALASASYNAGPGAVARWLRDRGDLELDEFVEEIPIEETRNYVKRVLTSFSAYRLTYGEGEGRFPLLEPQRARP